jgi:hypothetical protein
MKKEIKVKVSGEMLEELKYLSSLPSMEEDKKSYNIRKQINDYLYTFNPYGLLKPKETIINIKKEEFKIWYFWWLFEKNETSIESKQTGLNYNKNLYDERIMLLKKLMDYFAPIIAEEVINRGQIKQEDKTIATYKIKLN